MSKLLFHRVAVIGRQRVSGIGDTVTSLIEHLTNLQVNVVIDEETATWYHKDIKAVPHDKLNHHADLIIVVGGDGSLLNAARIAAEQELPVLGINRGTLGFLTDISPDNIDDIDAILAGEYQQEERFLLEALLPNEQSLTALNDIVLHPGHSAKMISFTVAINNQLAYSLRADGLIIASTTGSTAYSLSGGGPILHPNMDAMVLVPISPHTLSSRPIVIDGNSHITITVNTDNTVEPELSSDGQDCIALKPGDEYHVRKYAKRFKLIHPKDYDYFATLRNKLHWKG